MPKKYQSVLFWFDGAFTETVASLTLSALLPDLKGSERITLRQKLLKLQTDLSIGKMDVLAYCNQAGEATGVNLAGGQWVNKIMDRAVLNQALFDIYAQIAPEHDPKVVVDIPEAWFYEMISRWNIAQAFPQDRLIFTERFHLKRMYPDIFYFIPQAAGRQMDECLMVDPHQMRAVAAHKLGLASAVYAYPRRLKMDLALQKIWKTDEDVYHPKAGARANI